MEGQGENAIMETERIAKGSMGHAAILALRALASWSLLCSCRGYAPAFRRLPRRCRRRSRLLQRRQVLGGAALGSCLKAMRTGILGAQKGQDPNCAQPWLIRNSRTWGARAQPDQSRGRPALSPYCDGHRGLGSRRPAFFRQLIESPALGSGAPACRRPPAQALPAAPSDAGRLEALGSGCLGRPRRGRKGAPGRGPGRIVTAPVSSWSLT